MKPIWIATAAATVLVAGAAIAGSHGMGGDGMGGDGMGRHGGHDGPRWSFEQLDTDGDGKITREEADAFRAAHVAGIDTDGDGFITAEELEAHHMAMMRERHARMIEQMDEDGDGKVALSEFGGPGMGKMFERADADGDGVITKEEADNMRQMHHGKKGHRGDCPRDGDDS